MKHDIDAEATSIAAELMRIARGQETEERRLLMVTIREMSEADQDDELPMRLKTLLWYLRQWRKGLV